DEARDLARVLIVRGLLGARQRAHETRVDSEARLDQRGVDPEAEPGVERIVRGARREPTDRLPQAAVNPPVDGVHPLDGDPRPLLAAEHERVAGVERAPEAPPRIRHEATMVSHARRHQRMGDLEQEGPARAQEEDGLAVDRPDRAARRERPRRRYFMYLRA